MNKQLLAISGLKHDSVWWYDDNTWFLLDQHTDHDINSAISLNQQYAGRCATPL